MFIPTGLVPTAEQCYEFFKKLDLPHSLPLPSFKLRPRAFGDELLEEAITIGKDTPLVLAFADKLSYENRQAAKNSTQLAEKFADGKADRNTQSGLWHSHYSKAMWHCGWFMANNDVGVLKKRDKTVTMDTVVMEIIATVAGANAAAFLPLMGKVLETIKTDAKVVTLFEQQSRTGANNSVRLMPCIETANGEVISVFTGFEHEYNENKGGALWWKWDLSSIDIKKVATMVNFNFDHYKRQESNILTALGASSDSFFSDLDLGK